jgi:hypothetical protein
LQLRVKDVDFAAHENRGAGREGRQGSFNHASWDCGGTAARSSRGSSRAAPEGFEAWRRKSGHSQCTGAQVSKRVDGVAMAICLSSSANVH